MERSVMSLISNGMLILLVFAISCTKKQSTREIFNKEFSNLPRNFDKKIDQSLRIADADLNLRCKGLDGPKSTKSAFNENEKSIEHLERWTDENHFLFERAVLSLNIGNYFISVKQSGCSHFGYGIKIVSSEGFEFDDVNQVNQFIEQISEGPQISKSGKSIFKESMELVVESIDKNRIDSNCILKKSNFIECNFYKDPRNTELTVKDNKIGLDYWYVL